MEKEILFKSASQLMWERAAEDTKTRLKNADQLARNENAIGLYDLAQCYRYGWGLNVNYQNSLELYKRAAEKGHAGACYELARLYLQGNILMGINKDFEVANNYIQLGIGKNKQKILDFDTPNYKQAEYISQLENLSKVLTSLRQMENQHPSPRIN